MLFFIILLIVGLAIWANWHYVHIIQQCEKYINLIDTDDNPKNIDKIPECVSFLEKNWTKIRKKAFTDNQYHDKIGDFLTSLCGFKEREIYQKKAFIYGQQLCGVLTHTIKDKELKKQIATEIKNNKYIPKIENNEEDHFSWNLLNHFVHVGNPVDGESIEIRYPDVFKNINVLSLQYLKDNKYKMEKIVDELHRAGERFLEPKTKWKESYEKYRETAQIPDLMRKSQYSHSCFEIVSRLGGNIYPKTGYDVLNYLLNKKVIDNQTAKEYKSILDGTYDKEKAKKEAKIFKETFGYEYSMETSIDDNMRSKYIEQIIQHGDINEYIWLSDALGRLLFRVDSPGYYKYGDRSKDDWLISHKKMLDANTYGINPLLLFSPKDFEGDNYYYENAKVRESVLTEPIIKFKQDIDTILSAYYPVPNFLNHAREILDAYITGNTPFEKLSYDATWYNNYDRKLAEIQLQTLSPYEIFGYTVGYLTYCVSIKKRFPAKYLQIKDSALIAYLDSLEDKTFDDTCELYTRIDNLRTAIYRWY